MQLHAFIHLDGALCCVPHLAVVAVQPGDAYDDGRAQLDPFRWQFQRPGRLTFLRGMLNGCTAERFGCKASVMSSDGGLSLVASFLFVAHVLTFRNTDEFGCGVRGPDSS